MSHDEFELIARYFAPLARGAGALGLTDDAAIVVPPAGCELVVSTDAIVEGVHFLAGEAADVVGRRLLAVGFSDVAAMAAAPLSYTLVVALPKSWAGDRLDGWLGGFAAGLAAGADALGVDLLGGDTVATPGPLTLSLTVFGAVAPGTAVRRSGARPGDLVCVSGSIGDATLGLAVLQGRLTGLPADVAAHLVARFRLPQARCRLGQALAGLATAAADVSDGLIADLGHICRASAVTATIGTNALPVSAAAGSVLAAGATTWPALLSGGDDYELVFTIPPDRQGDLDAAAAAGGVAVTVIGRCEAAVDGGAGQARTHPVRVTGAAGRLIRIDDGGYRHF